MEKKSFVLKGNIVYSGENKELCSIEGGYVVCENGICRGAFEKLPKQYETLPLTDYGDKIILCMCMHHSMRSGHLAWILNF